MSFNWLSGTVPSEIGLLTSMRELDLSFNRFTGTIPSELGRLTKLSGLHLESNSIVGRVPDQVCVLKDEFALSRFFADYCKDRGVQTLDCSDPACCNSCHT